MAPKPKPAAGAPRWTYVLGAIVGAAALLWGIVSHFVPKREADKPTVAAVPVTRGAASVSVTGAGAVGVGGDVTGSTINAAAPPPATGPARTGSSP
jgi:hypothetical protein